MIRPKNSEATQLNIEIENAKLHKAEVYSLTCQSVFTKFEIIGNNETLYTDDLNKGLVVTGDGSWKQLNTTSSLKPWRVYLKISKASDLPWIEEETFDIEQLTVTLTVRGDDGGANGIENSKFELNVADSKYYDLMGRVVEHPVKGRIYIVNGKKVVY